MKEQEWINDFAEEVASELQRKGTYKKDKEWIISLLTEYIEKYATPRPTDDHQFTMEDAVRIANKKTAPTDEEIREYARTRISPYNWENLNEYDEAYYDGIIDGAKGLRDGLIPPNAPTDGCEHIYDHRKCIYCGRPRY